MYQTKELAILLANDYRELGRISKKDSDCSFYLLFGSLDQVCELGIKYISKYGQADILLTKKEYEDLRKEYKENRVEIDEESCGRDDGQACGADSKKAIWDDLTEICPKEWIAKDCYNVLP